MRLLTTWTTAFVIGATALGVPAQDPKTTNDAPDPAALPPAPATAPTPPRVNPPADGDGDAFRRFYYYNAGRQAPARRPAPAPTRAQSATQPAGDYLLLARSLLAPSKAAYLGVNTSPAQPALQKQLQLKPGIGLVVDGVDPGSPAEQGGVKEYDVLHKLDEQLLINADQFAVLVRNYEPGADVKLTVIREGKPLTLAAKLVERDVPPMQFSVTGDTDQHFVEYGLALNRADELRAPFVTFFDANAGTVEMTAPGGKRKLSAAQVTIEDDEHKLIVSKRDGRKYVKVTDKAGKVVFDGPVDTKAQLDKIPGGLLQACRDILLDTPLTADGAPKPPVDPGAVPIPAKPRADKPQ